MFNIYRI